MGLKKRAARTEGYCISLARATFALLPSVWVLLTLLEPSRGVLMMPPKRFPSVTIWEGYVDAYRAAPSAVCSFNSAIASLTITAEELVTIVPATYTFSQTGLKGKNALFMLLVATMMVPGEILIIPNYVTLADLGWVNAYRTLVLLWCASVFSTSLLKRQFSSIPAAYYKATRTGRYHRFRCLITVMVPTSKPTIVVAILLKLIDSWNSYMRPLIVTNTNGMRTLPVTLAAFSTEADIQYNTPMASSPMIISPMLPIYFFTRKYTIRRVNNIGLEG